MKQIIHDLIHMTQIEFAIAHPFVILGIFISIISVWAVLYFINRRTK